MLSTKFRFIWPSGFRGEGFKNRTIRNKNCLWRPCFLMDRDEMSIFYRGPSIDAPYQVSVHLAEGFQRRRLKCEKLTDDRQQTTDTKWWQKLTLQGKLIKMEQLYHNRYKSFKMFIQMSFLRYACYKIWYIQHQSLVNIIIRCQRPGHWY